MKDIIKIIKLDMLSIRPYFTLKNLIILVGMSIFYALISKNIYVSYGVASLFTILFCSYPFLVGEESGIDTLYAAFGIKREKVVLGRYFWSNLVILMGLLTGSILAVISSLMLKQSFGILEHIFSILGMFVFNSIIISIQYPFYFKYGYRKAKTVISSIFLLIVILIFALTYFKDSLKGVVGFIIQNPSLIILMFFLIWICLYAISIKSSRSIYKNRDLV